MTTRRRVLLYGAAGLATLLFLLVAAPFVFRDRIVEKVKAGISRSVAARVDWSSAGLTLFRDFPNLTLRLDRLSVTGVDRFQGDTLLAVPRLRVVLDLASVLRSLRGNGAVVVRAVELDRPAAHLEVLEDGTASWDIARKGPEPSGASRGFDVNLRRLDIRGGSVSLDNRQSRLAASVAGLSESLRGDFSSRRFLVSTSTTADTVSLRFAGVPYLSRARLDVAADLDVDRAAGKVTIARNRIRLNDLVLALTGSVASAGDDVAMDISFRAPATDFKEILSLVPVVYARSFSTVRTTGTMAVSGWVRGRYGPKAFPALALQAQVRDASFRYPDLPLPARDIAADIAVANPGGSVDGTVVRLGRFHLVMGSNPVDGSFVMRTPVSDPDLDVRLNGRVDLADVRNTVKLPNVDRLSGAVVANAAVRARMSDVDARRYERVAASGTLAVSDVVLEGKTLPHPLHVQDARLTLTPSRAELSSFQGTVGHSDIAATGYIQNLLGYALRDEALRGAATVTSRSFDLNEWRSDDKLQAIPVPPNLDLALQATVGHVTFGRMDLRNARGSLQVRDRRVTLQDFSMDLLGGAMTMAGFYETTNMARPTFDLDLHLSNVDIPAAFSMVRTVQSFVPVARFAQGRASADLKVNGAVGPDMMPVQNLLSALGSFRTAGVTLHGFPAMARLADMLKIDQLRNPALADLRSTIEIRNGRLHVKPFDAKIGKLTMNVSGSNGIDQSLQYALGLALPRAALGAEANRAVTEVVAKAGRAGLRLDPSEIVNLAVQLAGTITNPSLSTGLRDMPGAVVKNLETAAKAEAGRRLDSARARVDSAAADAGRRASAEAARLVADAQQRATAMREQARVLADSVRRVAYERADSLAQRPTSPLARIAAKAAADRLRKEADARAEQILRGANARADSLVAEAQRKASGAR